MQNSKVVDLRNGLLSIEDQGLKFRPSDKKLMFGDIEIQIYENSEGGFAFLVKDILESVDYSSKTTSAINSIDEEFKFKIPIVNIESNRTYDQWAITELGLYQFLTRTNAPKAKEFQRWVYNTLLTIRKTGSYSITNTLPEILDVQKRMDVIESVVSTLATTVSNQTILINSIATDIGGNMTKLITLISDSNLERKQKDAIIAHKDRVVDRLHLEIYHDKNLTYLTISEFLKGLNKKLIPGTTLPMVGDYITREMIVNRMGSPLKHPKNNTRTFPIYILEDFFKYNPNILQDIKTVV